MKPNNWFKQNFHPLRKKIRDDPYYRFRTLEEIAIAADIGIRINVASAGVDDWLRLPGISIHQARQLVNLTGMGVELLSIEDLAAALSIPVGRIKPFEPILEFTYHHPESLLSPTKINPNTADPGQLKEVVFIDANLAGAILEERKRGDFKDLIDFKTRLNLDAATISDLMHYLKFF